MPTHSQRRDAVSRAQQAACLLAAYDDQLRTDAETPSALTITRRGPLRLVTFVGGRGFVSYQDLDGADAETIRTLVAEAVDYYQAQPEINRIDGKPALMTLREDCTRRWRRTGSPRANRSRSWSARRGPSQSTVHSSRG